MCEPVNKHNRTAALSIRWGLFAFALLLVAGFAFTYFQQQRSIDAAQARIDELTATLAEAAEEALTSQEDETEPTAQPEETPQASAQPEETASPDET